MKKRGFTLAEVLITVGIVGILGAVTIPTLVEDNQNQVNANSLSTAVSDFENAMTAMITRDNVSNLYETEAWKKLKTTNTIITSASKAGTNVRPRSISDTSTNVADIFLRNIFEVLNIDTFTSGPATYYGEQLRYLGASEKVAATTVMGNTIALESTKGFTYHIRSVNIADETIDDLTALTAGVNLSKTALWVFIDTNGKNKPNLVGRDIFGFLLGADGVLYPLGGRDVAYRLQSNATYTWNSDSSTYTCTDTSKKQYALGCTARLIDNKYKMDY